MYGRYQAGQEILGREVGRTSVSKIQQALVQILSPNYTTKVMTYDYNGSERDSDIAERFRQLSFSGRFRRFEKGTFWNTQRGCDFILKGAASLPPCEATVMFKKGANVYEGRWKVDAW